ncbi:MAG TPA: histidine kinase [Candidatus Dormibacteraeota bacterium]|jgi:signal transduction histidine kinase|nr:histidine kinase [Candidatus Dormibacteraeota bacterium]
MTTATASRLAWAFGILGVVLTVAALVLVALDWRAGPNAATGQLAWFLDTVIAGSLGLLIATRRPRNPIGWLLLAIGLGNAVYLVADFAAIRGLLSGVPARSWPAWGGWVFNWIGGTGAALLAFLILFFPDGRLPSPRWRWALWVGILVGIGITVLSMLAPAPVQLSAGLPEVPNPIGLRASNQLLNAGSDAIILSLLIPAAAVVTRLRRARGLARQQLIWFALVAAVTVALVVISIPLGVISQPVGSTVSALAFDLGIGVLLPATIGIAVIKDGLYDIDLFISRAVVYASLAVFITAVYIGIAVGIGDLIGSGGRPNLALSILATAVVAVGFQPVRHRVQRLANRLVYGQRATPYEVLSEFSGRVADAYAAEGVLTRMARVLQEGTGAERAVVWLRDSDQLQPAAAYPELGDAPAPVTMADGVLPPFPGAEHTVEVRHQGELLGAITVSSHRGESLTPIETKLIDDLARQAGLVLKNVGLTAELSHRVDELRVSRQRLVRTQDEERRRLERNLHDGAQQHLVALKVKLGLVQALTDRNPERATAMLEQLEGDADQALDTLRDLARGIYPAQLTEAGLAAALRAQAARSTVPVGVGVDGVTRHPLDIEATVYFCVLEALQNVQKYARASRAEVHLEEVDGELRFAVEDDGCGFDVAEVVRGSGLTNMTDRLDAVGGRLRLDSSPGHGSRVTGRVPLRPRSEAAAGG